mgnify:CR=1 FL=1
MQVYFIVRYSLWCRIHLLFLLLVLNAPLEHKIQSNRHNQATHNELYVGADFGRVHGRVDLDVDQPWQYIADQR